MQENSSQNTAKVVLVPDLGGFKNVEIIEICVKLQQVVEKDQTLLILESDKATIDIPAEASGLVQELLVQVGDRVSQGDAILKLITQSTQITQTTQAIQVSETQPDAKKMQTQTPPPISSAPVNPSKNSYDFDVVVIGAGPGGYSAAFRAADLGLKVALIEKHSNLGGVCLNVGCIPSKALLHYADLLEKAQSMASAGLKLTFESLDLEALRADKNQTVQKLTQGLKAMAKMRQVTVFQGLAEFIDTHHLTIKKEADVQKISFAHAIIATGSRSIDLPFLPKDSRIINSTGALELPFVPKRMLIIGGGIIGLEMATVYHALGQGNIKIDVVEMQNRLVNGADLDLVKIWQKRNQSKTHPLFDQILTQTKTIAARADEAAVYIEFENIQTHEKFEKSYDLVLVAVGRSPNTSGLGLEQAGVNVDRGFIKVDNQLRTSAAHIFAIGDVIGQPMLAHKAVHEGHVAAEVIAGEKSYFDAKVIPSVAYTHPEIAWAGETEESANAKNIPFKKAVFPWQASGRAIANHTEDGFTKLLFSTETGRIIGGAVVGDHAGDLIGEIALAIEMGADAVDIAKTIHPHPTLCESVGMAAEVAKGTCTDVPPTKSIKS
jgi:dihydrolipoamide dehydrogenase